MRHSDKQTGWVLLAAGCASLSLAASPPAPPPQTGSALASSLGWTLSEQDFCGGYYQDPAFLEGTWRKDNHIEITGAEGLFSFQGTSTGRGRITVTRRGQQMIANHAKLYRDPKTHQLSRIVLSGDVSFREPENLVIAEEGTFDLRSREEILRNVLYRASFSHRRPLLDPALLKRAHRLTEWSVWGQAKVFEKNDAGIINLEEATYSTCPPLNAAWHLKASKVHLDRNTGRGSARHVRIYLREVPVFYTPWLNFPIDARRQTGFLPPSLGSSGKYGAWLNTPFYWNMAPNYDMTLTPGLSAKRGFQASGLFRYLTPGSSGSLSLTVLPHDPAFSAFQRASLEKYSDTPNPYVQAELRRLEHASTMRSAIVINDTTRFDEHWSGSIDYSRVSDDYYLRDLNANINEVTNNQLLQEGRINYEGRFWELTGRLQGYQALHPLDEVSVVQNQYARLPQLILHGTRPNGFLGLDWSANSELTRFALSPTPGNPALLPVGDRLHLQPGVTLPLEAPWYFLRPRLQLALTEYRLSQVTAPNPSNPSRTLPIFDTHAGLYFDRDLFVSGQAWQQTLEPEIYYTYVPYRNQNDLPLFDTSYNTLTYDQIFIFNRFNGIDRIGDANQISYGVTTRLLHGETHLEKLRAGIGQILYLENRRVTLGGPPNPNDTYGKSPLTGILSWQIAPAWNLTGDSIWNVRSNEFNNQTLALTWRPAPGKTVNLGYSFVRGGDIQAGDSPNSPSSNLSQTDLSFAWPVSHHWNVVGRWTQNWNHHHFQNLLYGLEYDTCCWAVRFVAARAFAGLNPAGTTYQYTTGVSLEFALKGLGSIGNNDPGQLLSNSIAGYQSNFGQIA